MILKGIVRSGKNDFSYWLDLLEPFYTAKTGMKLFPGTLNVHLIDRFYSLPPKVIRLEKQEYGGSVSVSIVPCKIFDRNAFILRTDNDTGKHGDPAEKILEIATDIKLRDTYSLQDGDRVSIEIPDSQDD
jgi:CTP-dependent riboflavin kinase